MTLYFCVIVWLHADKFSGCDRNSNSLVQQWKPTNHHNWGHQLVRYNLTDFCDSLMHKIRQDVNVSVDAMIETESGMVLVSVRVNHAGCGVGGAGGVFFRVFSSGSWEVTYNISMWDVLYHHYHATVMGTLA